MSPAKKKRPQRRTYCRPEKWRNICATFQRYYEQQTWFKLDVDEAAPFYQFTDAPEIDDHFVCCDGKISSPIIMAGIKYNCGDHEHEHEGLLYVSTNNCVGVSAEKQGHLLLRITWDEDSDEENDAQEHWHPDDVLIAIWEAAEPAA